MAAGVDATEETPRGISEVELIKAVSEGDVDETTRLLKVGVNPKICNELGSSLLHIAISNNNLQILDVLVHYSEIIDVTDKQGLTPLIFAIHKKNYEAVKRLLKAGANVNLQSIQKDSPLHVAIKIKNTRIFELLMSQSNINLEVQNGERRTALYMACERGMYKMVEQLVEAGADVDSENDMYQTALHVAVFHPKIAHFLIRKGADINAIDADWNSPLHFAVRFGCIETIAMLLYYECDIDIENEIGWTPFILALHTRDIEVQDMFYGYYTEPIPKAIQDITLDSAFRTGSPYAPALLITNLNDCTTSFLTYILPHIANDTALFKNLWDGLRSDVGRPLDEEFLAMEWLFYLRNNKTLLEKNIVTLIESPNTDLLIKCFSFRRSRYVNQLIPNTVTFPSFLTDMHKFQCSVDLQTQLVFRLLELSVDITTYELYTIYVFYGNNTLFKLLRYVKYEGHWSWKDDPYCCILRLIFDVGSTVTEIKKELLQHFSRDVVNLQGCKKGLEHYLKFCSHRQLMQQCDYKLGDGIISTMPKLAELARDSSRDYLIKSYNITNCSQYHTIVDNLIIPLACKEILHYEQELYRLKL